VQTRDWVGEELAFSHAVKGVLEDLGATAFPPPFRSPDLLDKVVRQIEAQEQRGQGEALALSGHFDRVQEDLHGLRDRVARMEVQARHVLDQSLRDALTGLWNRRAYEARIGEEVSRAVRYGAPVSLVVWDVDRLRGINDEHGHQVGDAVLRELTGRILGALRRSDFVARYGGEEFVAVLPNTPLVQAANVASKIRAAAETGPIRLPGGLLSVTVSAGVASLEPCDDPAALFARAERALARAKAGGRNRAEVEGP
jgi:diguanylate cyclase